MSEERDAAVERLRRLIERADQAEQLEDGAVDDLRARFPKDLEVRLWCDVAEVHLGEPARAWELLELAAAAYRERPHVWTLQHLVALLRVAPDRLVERFEASLLDPEDDELLAAAGVAFGAEDRLELAIRWFDRVLERDPGHLQARTLGTWTRWLLTVDPDHEEEMRALAAAHPEDETIADLLREMTG